MNTNIKRIATESLQRVTNGQQIDMSNLESMIDSYVAEVIKTTVIECSTVVRNIARTEANGETRSKLKLASLDIEEHFGV